jgi:hypothetical protein
MGWMVTEEDWLAGTNRYELLRYCRFDHRKLRLFAVACCRSIHDVLADPRSRTAVVVAERFADGQVSDRELRKAAADAESAHKKAFDRLGKVDSCPVWAAAYAAHHWAYKAATNADWMSATAIRNEEERQVHAVLRTALIHDVFGNPFRPLPPIAPTLLAWNGGLVVKLAQAAYDDRILPSGHLNPDHLAVLGDALDEAGADAALVAHLRGPAPHVRGCVVVDMLTNRDR